MEWSKILLDNFAHFFVLCLFGLLCYLLKGFFIEPLRKQAQILNEQSMLLVKHISDDDKARERFELLYAQHNKTFEAINERLEIMSERYHDKIIPALGLLSAEIAGLKSFKNKNG